MAKVVKCQYCKNKIHKEFQEYHAEKKYNSFKYFHLSCWEKEFEKREFKRKDTEKFDELVEYIEELYGMEMLPKSFYAIIQDIRNGSYRFKTNPNLKYKQGYDYLVIKKAYKICEKKIKIYSKQKKFKSDLQMLKYGLAIVSNHLHEAREKLKKEQIKEETYVNPSHSYSERKVKPAKKFPKK